MNGVCIKAGGIIGACFLLSLVGCIGDAPRAATAEVPPQVLQEATANALGNMAWESVKVSEVLQEGARVKWLATTVTGKWRCQSQVDGKKPYCER